MQVEETAGSEGSERQSYLELYRRLADSFRHILVRTAAAAPAREHLADRGFSAESLDRYRVGYAPRDRDWLLRFPALPPLRRRVPGPFRAVHEHRRGDAGAVP